MTTTRKTASHAARTVAAQPLTLAAQALQSEQARHALRIAELKSMAARLRMLDAYMPAIRAAGIAIHGEELHSWGGKAIHVIGATLNPQRNATLERVLRDCGMREVRRSDYTSTYVVELRKGHLSVAMTVEVRHLQNIQQAARQLQQAQGAAKCE